MFVVFILRFHEEWQVSYRTERLKNCEEGFLQSVAKAALPAVGSVLFPCVKRSAKCKELEENNFNLVLRLLNSYQYVRSATQPTASQKGQWKIQELGWTEI